MKEFNKSVILIFILFLVSALSSCSSGGGGGGAPAASCTGPRQWTYMVYMGADNNLSDAGLGDLKEMEKVGSSACVAVVVQAEFSPKYSASAGITESLTGRVLVQKGVNSLTAGDLVGNGIVDMASPAALTDFITWAKTYYPAEHYALVIWDHGSGWKTRKLSSPLKGAVQDETSGHFMSLPDLAKGVRDANVPLDIINFDACLMAMYEVAYEFKGLTDYMTFSEQTEPGEGDPYDTILGALTVNPLMTAQSLASTIADKYDQFYTSNNRGGTTKSAVDMSKLATLDTKLLALAAALQNDAAGSAVVNAAITGATTQNYAYPSNHDLWHLSDYLVKSAAGAAVKTAAGEVKTAVTAMVIDNQTNGTDMANSHGLAVYLPLASETNAQDLNDYAQLASNKTVRNSTAGTWGSYLETLLSGVSGGTASYKPGDYGLYIWWTTTNGQPCDADLDLYVWEPAADYGTTGNGDFYAPWMGQTSPNGFFSADSSISGKSEEYYLANSQVLAGDYYFMINFYQSGASCNQAQVHLSYYDPSSPPFYDTAWHEVTSENLGITLANPSPQILDGSHIWTTEPLTTIFDLNGYSDWWVPLSITKAAGVPQFLNGSNPPELDKRSQMIIRYKKGSRFFGIGK